MSRRGESAVLRGNLHADDADDDATVDGTGAGTVEEAVAAHGAVVWRFAVGLLGDPDDADDVAQETFLRVHQHLDGFQGRSRLRTWILSICRNLCIDRLRSRRPRPVPLGDTDPDDLPGSPDATGPDPSERADLRRLLAEGMARLSVEQREAFVLVDVLGLTGVEAAELVGVPPTTLRDRLYRAHDHLVNHIRGGDTA